MSAILDINTSRARRAALLATALLVTLAVTAGLRAGVGYADQMTVFSCHAPGGEAVGNDGWTIERSGGAYMTATDTCASEGKGALELELSGSTAGYTGAARVQWNFDAPTWATIASYELHLAGSDTVPPSGGEGQAFVDASDESDPIYDYRNLGDGAWGSSVISRTPPDEVTWIATDASCDGEDGECPANVKVASLDVSAARIVLNDSSTPTVSNIAGPLVSGSVQHGESEITFDAAESGPGIYAAHLVIDGVAEPSTVLDTNNGWCQNLGQTSDGTRSFAHPDPCPASLSAGLQVNTTQLTDGTHLVKLIVEDAAGDSTIGWAGTITTQNTPASNGTAGTLGSAGVGGPAGAPNGTPASQNATIHLHRHAAFTRTYNHRAFKLTGQLTNNQAQPIAGAVLEVLQQTQGTSTPLLIAHATTSAAGMFTIEIPAGPSRLIEVAYKAFTSETAYAATATVRESVSASARLEIIQPSRSPTGTIYFAGKVQGPIPRQGTLVQILVHWHGHWELLRNPRTNSNGYFHAEYQFQGSIGAFPFRAEIPTGQTNFPYTHGYSNSITIHTI
jgi:hypothetical protein